MALANDLRKGMAIKYNGNPAIILEVSHRTPGNLRAFVQCIIRYLSTGKSADIRFSSTEKVETVETHRVTLEFSYQDHQGYHFMDPETFETITLQTDLVTNAKDFLTENLPVEILYIEGKPLSLELPSTVDLLITESPEGIKGDSSTNVMKPATLETGKIINVPLFIKEGERVKVSTKDSTYISRA